MTRPISKAERRALADVLRHMRGAGVKRAERLALAGKRADKLAYSIPVSRGSLN